MVGTAMTKDIGSLFQATVGLNDSFTSGAGNDNVAVVSVFVDKSNFCSAKVIAVCKAALTAAKHLILTIGMQDADKSDGTGAADFGTFTTAKTVATGAGTKQVTAEADFNVEGARQWVALKITAHLDKGDTDTLVAGYALCLGGAREEPTSLRLN